MSIVSPIVQPIVRPIVQAITARRVGGAAPTVPALALRDRFDNPIVDRFGNYILVRA